MGNSLGWQLFWVISSDIYLEIILISGFYYIIVPNDYINTAQQVRPKISNTKFLRNKVSMCMKANSSSEWQKHRLKILKN